MAKKSTKSTPVVQVEVTEVTIKHLEALYNLPGKTLRVIIRGLGFRAPKTGKASGEMGPTHKYVWMSDDTRLTAIHAAIGNFIDTAGKEQSDAE